jgi:hypothetical protein
MTGGGDDARPLGFDIGTGIPAVSRPQAVSGGRPSTAPSR